MSRNYYPLEGIHWAKLPNKVLPKKAIPFLRDRGLVVVGEDNPEFIVFHPEEREIRMESKGRWARELMSVDINDVPKLVVMAQGDWFASALFAYRLHVGK